MADALPQFCFHPSGVHRASSGARYLIDSFLPERFAFYNSKARRDYLAGPFDLLFHLEPHPQTASSSHST